MLLFDPTVRKVTGLNRLHHMIKFTALDRAGRGRGGEGREKKKNTGRLFLWHSYEVSVAVESHH